MGNGNVIPIKDLDGLSPERRPWGAADERKMTIGLSGDEMPAAPSRRGADLRLKTLL